MELLNRKNERRVDLTNGSKQTDKGRIGGNELGYNLYRAIEFRNTNMDKRNLMLQFEYVRNRF